VLSRLSSLCRCCRTARLSSREICCGDASGSSATTHTNIYMSTINFPAYKSTGVAAQNHHQNHIQQQQQRGQQWRSPGGATGNQKGTLAVHCGSDVPLRRSRLHSRNSNSDAVETCSSIDFASQLSETIRLPIGSLDSN